MKICKTKWHIITWPISMGWMFNWGLWPNDRYPTFKFWNIGFIEVRHFVAFKKKVCKRCGQDLPANGGDNG